MALPSPARQRLAAPLREAVGRFPPIREFHTLPVEQDAWTRHTATLVASLDELARSERPPLDDFEVVATWVGQLLATCQSTASHLLALEPFSPFDSKRAETVLKAVEDVAQAAARSVEDATTFICPVRDLREVARWWEKRDAPSDDTGLLSSAFLVSEAVVDDEGEFRAEWVMHHYAYRGSELLQHLLPHLASLGLPNVTDMLAAVSIVGSILNCDDPITAYVAMDSFITRDLGADPDVASAVRGHLTASEPALLRSRRLASREWARTKNQSDDSETRALALVGAYTPLTEGPFRQFSWALYCLRRNSWESPPMLSSLRERLIAGGGSLGRIADDVVLQDLRNADTHQTLKWDGYADEFVCEGSRISPAVVVHALVLADSFTRGCAAGLVAALAVDARPYSSSLPLPDEAGRLPSWQRVRAFFGTNRLRLTDARLNQVAASIRVQRLAFTDINPCFQALVLAHRLLPKIETFSVSTTTGKTPIIVVSSRGLEAVMPVWEYAVSTVDQIPLSTFLAANLDSRLRVEPKSVAVRSIAWIAVDDAVGVIDGSSDAWDSAARRLITVRLRIVEMAIKEAARLLDQPHARLVSALDSVSELRNWIETTSKANALRADDQLALQRLRVQWAAWGPVSRHPLISNEDAPDLSERQPTLREMPHSLDYLTL